MVAIMARSSSLAVPGWTIPTSLSVAPHSLVVKLIDEPRNLEGRSMFCVPLLILFPSHLWRRDSVAHLVATCHALVGWTWARSLTRHLFFPRLNFMGRNLKAFSFLHFGCLSHLWITPIFCNSVTPPFFELRLPCSFFFKYSTLPFLISLRFVSNRSFFLCIFFPFILMHECSEVRHHCPSVLFLFACLGVLPGSRGWVFCSWG